MSAGSIPSGAKIRDPGFPTESENYLTNSKGILSWMFTLDHKRIGVMYLIGVTVAFALRVCWRWRFGCTCCSPTECMFKGAEANNYYNQVFTLHGAIMVFLFIIPSIPAALGNFLVPVMLGAKDVAFPRLNLCSFYLWVFGAIFFVCALCRQRTRYRLDVLHALQHDDRHVGDRGDAAARSFSVSVRFSPV